VTQAAKCLTILACALGAFPGGANAQDPIPIRAVAGTPAESLYRVRGVDPEACGTVPLVRSNSRGEVRDTVFTMDMLERRPHLRRVGPPHYSADDVRGRDIRSFAVLSVLLEANGQPSQVQVLRSSGNRRVDEALRQSLMESFFNPARRGGRNAAVLFCQTVTVTPP
jgi:TonB family protein